MCDGWCLKFADDGSSGVGASRPIPQPRSNPAAAELLLDEPSLLMSAGPSDPTPALIPLSSGGDPPPVQNEVGAVDKERSSSPVPVKPERKKKKGPPPTVPAPYTGPKKVATEVREEKRGGEGVGGRGRDVFGFEQVSDIFKNWGTILDTRKQRLSRWLPKYQLVWGGLHRPMNCCV